MRVCNRMRGKMNRWNEWSKATELLEQSTGQRRREEKENRRVQQQQQQQQQQKEEEEEEERKLCFLS